MVFAFGAIRHFVRQSTERYSSALLAGGNRTRQNGARKVSGYGPTLGLKDVDVT